MRHSLFIFLCLGIRTKSDKQHKKYYFVLTNKHIFTATANLILMEVRLISVLRGCILVQAIRCQTLFLQDRFIFQFKTSDTCGGKISTRTGSFPSNSILPWFRIVLLILYNHLDVVLHFPYHQIKKAWYPSTKNALLEMGKF